MRILVVEDQQDLNEIIVRKLKREYYSVDSCLTGDDALAYLACAEYDAIVLDIMLPGITGLGILKKLRSSGDTTPVLLLTALSSVEERVAGLDAGADDYLVKPFDFDELLARLRALIRRGGERASSQILCGDLTMDTASREVTRQGKPISLTAREFDVLEYLLTHQGKVLSREKICNHIWNYDYEGASNVIDVHVYQLRKKIDQGYDVKIINTVKGVGYMCRYRE
ncbi:MAG: response regulator transcription factor [Eubacterium sp.]|nr:response regulator transcription factor [Eubacterium sp.]